MAGQRLRPTQTHTAGLIEFDHYYLVPLSKACSVGHSSQHTLTHSGKPLCAFYHFFFSTQPLKIFFWRLAAFVLVSLVSIPACIPTLASTMTSLVCPVVLMLFVIPACLSSSSIFSCCTRLVTVSRQGLAVSVCLCVASC